MSAYTGATHRAGKRRDGEAHDLVARLRATARRFRDAVAVEDAHDTVTYGELDAWSDRLAGALAGGGDNASPWIAVAARNRVSSIAGILAVLKAGRGFVAVSEPAGAAWQRSLLAGSGANQLLCEAGDGVRAVAEELPGVQVIMLHRKDAAAPVAATNASATPGDPCYLAYTSGTSGAPKGVAQSHGAVLHSAAAFAAMDAFRPGDRVSLITPLSFGASTQELFGALLSGATLCTYDTADTAVEELAVWVRRAGISVVFTVPSVLRQWCAASAGRAAPALRQVFVGGERFTWRDVAAARRAFGDRCRVIHTYGTSETKIVAANVISAALGVADEAVPVGQVVAGAVISVRDVDGRPLPADTEGELWVSGPGLADGYWRDARRTAARFVYADGRRWYRSGDVAAVGRDGVLSYRGRSEDLVKIDGRLVNVLDVEAALRGTAGVADVVVSGFDDDRGRARLGAALVAAAGKTLEPVSLRELLADSMPLAAVPSRFVFFDALPMGRNGKIDRAAVRETLGRGVQTAERTPPADPLERAVGRLWTEVLGVPVGGPDADFFELGASSLQAATLCSTINDLFGTALDVRRLVAMPTLAEQARYLDAAGGLEHGSGELVTGVAGTPGDPPLYLVPGGFGDRILFQFVYRRVAQWLGRRYHVLAVLPDEFSADEGGVPSLDTLARHLAADIEQRCPQGSVSLVGSCGGAVLAFETATRLPSRNTQLVLIDPIYPGGRVAHLLNRARKTVRRNLAFPRRVGARVSHHIAHLRHRSPREAIAYVFDKLALFRRFYVDATDREGAGIAEPAERRAVRQSRIRYSGELMSYRCERRYAGCVGLLVTADERFRRHAEKWRDVSAAAVFVDVPGDHQNHLRDHVDAIARTIAETIERLAGGGAGPDGNQPNSEG